MPYRRSRATARALRRRGAPQESSTFSSPSPNRGRRRGLDKARPDLISACSGRSPRSPTTVTLRALPSDTTGVETPDARLNEAFAWAKAGSTRGVPVRLSARGWSRATAPRRVRAARLPPVLRRDSMLRLWRPPLTATAASATARLPKKFQRAAAKPPEISRARRSPWFTDYYSLGSADATPSTSSPLLLLGRERGACAIPARQLGVRVKPTTLRGDGRGRDGLVRYTKFGHGWVSARPLPAAQ